MGVNGTTCVKVQSGLESVLMVRFVDMESMIRVQIRFSESRHFWTSSKVLDRLMSR